MADGGHEEASGVGARDGGSKSNERDGGGEQRDKNCAVKDNGDDE